MTLIMKDVKALSFSLHLGIPFDTRNDPALSDSPDSLSSGCSHTAQEADSLTFFHGGSHGV